MHPTLIFMIVTENVAHAKQNSSTASELENSNHLHLTNEHQLKDASQCTYPSSNVELFDDSGEKMTQKDTFVSFPS